MGTEDPAQSPLPDTVGPSEGATYDTLSRFLNSDRYINFLHQFGSDHRQRERIIGITLEYGVLHPDLFDIDTFLETMAKGGHFAADRIFATSIAKKLNVDQSSPEGKEAIFTYFLNRMITHGVYYHGFNGAFEDEIKQYGLDPNRRIWDPYELVQAREIGAKGGRGMLLGWAGINSEERISYSATAMNAYRYAIASPEWFAQFTGEDLDNSERSTAFFRRDHATARGNVVLTCEAMGNRITSQERDFLLNFFEKHWSIFAGHSSQPMVALIARDAILDAYPLPLPKTFAELADEYRRPASEIDITEAIGTVITRDGTRMDERTTSSIPTNKIAIVKLPDYNRVFPDNN